MVLLSKSSRRVNWAWMPGEVGGDRFGREEGALGRLETGIADHAGRTARERDDAMPCAPKPAQHEEPDEVAEVEAVGGRVEADVKGERGRAGREEPFQFFAIGHVGDQSAPMEFRKDGGSGHESGG